MGNHKFRLSDMIPNAWFYKLRDMNKTTRNSQSSSKKKKKLSSFSTTQKTSSYHYIHTTLDSPKSHCKIQTPPPRSFRVSSDIDDLFPDVPKRSSPPQRRSRRKTIYKPSPRRIPTSFDQSSSSDSSFDLDFLIKSPSTEFESENNYDQQQPEFLLKGISESSPPCSCGGFSCSAAENDIIIDAFDTIPILDLAPILTKPTRIHDGPDEKDPNFSIISPQLQEIETICSSRNQKGNIKTKSSKKNRGTSASARKSSASPPAAGIKLRRTNSPRIRRKSVSKKEEGLSESFAVVKSSVDPERDFKESMMEMILENNIRASKDLEELLACYLTLNSNEYHDLIIKAFEQIWFNVPHLHL